MRSLALMLVLAPLALSGCYTTVVRSGLPPAGPPTVEWDGKWHSGIAVGIAELSGPYKLPEVCPNGWAEIRTETSFLNVLVQGITMGLYNPQTVTVVCAGGGPPPGTPPAAAPPPETAPPPPPPPPPAAETTEVPPAPPPPSGAE